MKKIVLTLSFACAARADTTPEQVLDSMRKAYSGLHALHAIAVRSQTMTSGRGSMQSQDAEYELAEKPGGKYRAHFKVGDQEALAVSDGSKTWKAMPKAKQWSQINAAGVNESSGDTDDNAKPQRDLHSTAKDTVFLRYLALGKIGREPILVKEENCKLGKEKRRCYVVRTHVNDVTYDLWVDESTGFVLQEVQTSRTEQGGMPTEVKMTTRMKLIEVNNAVDDSPFQFAPESSWREVEMLVLPGEERTSLAGLKAGNFSAKSLDGETVELSSLRGKVVVLDFWATWCPPCREELPAVDKLRAEFADKVQFFGVNDEDTGTVKGYLRKNNNGLSTLMDQNGTVHRQYGVSAIPTVLIIDREGVIRSHFIGGRTREALKAAITQAMAAH